eukprot:6172313-Pleurochrysis_carterae.AAC.4
MIDPSVYVEISESHGARGYPRGFAGADGVGSFNRLNGRARAQCCALVCVALISRGRACVLAWVCVFPDT